MVVAGRGILIIDQHSAGRQQAPLNLDHVGVAYRCALVKADVDGDAGRLPQRHPAGFHAQGAEADMRARSRHRYQQVLNFERHDDAVRARNKGWWGR